MPSSYCESSDSDSEPMTHMERLLCEAIRDRRNHEAISLIETGRKESQSMDDLLCIGLFYAASYNNTPIAEYVLRLGAKPDGVAGKIHLLRAVDNNCLSIVKLLLSAGADINIANAKGHTAIMTAALHGHHDILRALLEEHADVNRLDSQDRTVLHNLAADKVCKWSPVIVTTLLETEIDVNSHDEVGRTPLHWAAATNKQVLCELLLTHRRGRRAKVDAVCVRKKTSLHIAASRGHNEVARLLLRYGANPNATSDGSWTPLHNACENGYAKTVRALLDSGAGLNSKLLDGMTPLHVATQAGHLETIECLLKEQGIDCDARDSFGLTPFLRAVQKKRRDIMKLLGAHPGNLSDDIMGSCRGFNATIVDFGMFYNGTTQRKTVYEVLYERDGNNPSEPSFSIYPKGDLPHSFRWIHLPANNIAWVEAALRKSLLGKENQDLSSFWALEHSFDYQHYGQELHSRYMRPLCQRESLSLESLTVPDPSSIDHPVILVSDDTGVDHQVISEPNDAGTDSPGSISSMIFMFMPFLHFETSQRYQEMQAAIRRSQLMKSIMERNEASSQADLRPCSTYDEMLLRGYITHKDHASLHIRRTLDQFLHHDINTQSGDPDQVVYRYQRWNREKDSSSDRRSNADPKILMVDQLWMWILDEKLVITAFPQRWQQPSNDPLNILDAILGDINRKTRRPIRCVFDLAASVTQQCSAVFNQKRSRNHKYQDYQLLDMMDAAIGIAMNEESRLFEDFKDASAEASQWFRPHDQQNQFSRYLGEDRMTSQQEPQDASSDTAGDENFSQIRPRLFVDRLLDIGSEVRLINEARRIRDELSIIRKVFEDQRRVLHDLDISARESCKEFNIGPEDLQNEYRDQLHMIDAYLIDIDRMDRRAERIYHSTTDLLDLKQKYTSTFGARFARDQAAELAGQRPTLVFTIVTVVFLPLSFIATLFTINIRELPHDTGSSGPSLPLSYVLKYMLSISFGISIPLIIIVLSYNTIGDIFREVKRRWKLRVAQKRERAKFVEIDHKEDGPALEQARGANSNPSLARSNRGSGAVV